MAASGMLITLPYMSSGVVLQRDVVAQRLAHLDHAVGAGQDAQDDADVGLLAQEVHQLARRR